MGPLPSIRRLDELRAERAAFESLEHGEHNVLLRPPAQLGTTVRKGRDLLLAPADAPVGEDQHAARVRSGPLTGEGPLPGPKGSDPSVHIA